MELKGEILINANRETVWHGLNDTQLLMRCIPGCESMEEISPNERQATVKIKIGPVRARFMGKVTMTDIIPAEGYTLQFEGSGGAAGMAKGQSVVTLSDDSGSTCLRYTVQASIGGKLGQVGGRMIDAAAKQIADQFFAVFQTEVTKNNTPLADASSTDSSTESPTTESAPISSQVSRAESIHPQPTLQTNNVSADHQNSKPIIHTSPSQSASQPMTESARMTWFFLGVLSTGFGVLLGYLISQ
jgi:uncharacterized protein